MAEINRLSERETSVTTIYRVKKLIERGKSCEHHKGAGRPEN